MRRRKLFRTSMVLALTAAITAASLAGLGAAGNVYAQEAGGTSVQEQFYVAVDGSDSNDGSQETPFATVERARQEVDKINGNMTGDIIVNIGPGEYYMDTTVKFAEGDSGTNGHQVIYRSEKGMSTARLNGGVLADGWVPTTADDIGMGLDESLVGKVYKTQLDPKEYQFNALYVNDAKATMARTRNYAHDPRFPAQRGEYMYSAGGGMRDLIWRNGDIDQKSIDGMVAAEARGEEEIAQLFVWDGGDWDWFTNTLPIHHIDESQRKVWADEVPGHKELNRTKYPIGSGARYYLQGNLAFLDVEGEYHYNKSTGELYYYPKADEKDMDAQKVVVPTVQEIFRFEGSDKPEIKDWGKEPDLKKQVSNITMDGLVFKNTEYTDYFTSGWNYSDAGGGIWEHAPESYGSTNPSYDEQTDRTEHKVGAITMINANHLTVCNTQIHNTGLWAVAMFKDNTDHVIRDCDFGYNGYGSVTIDGGYPAVGKYCNNITIENVRMHDVGQNIGHAAGLTVMSCGQSNFRNLEIYNSPRRAMMVSGGPKRDGTDSKLDQITDMYTIGNHFEYMHVYNCEQDSGEDSAVYVCMIFRAGWVQDKYGEVGMKTDETGRRYFDVSWDGVDRYNYFNQLLIDSVGSNPSMRDKNTVHGMDLCMGVSGMVLSNIKGTNNQSCTLRIEEGGGDKYFMDNLNNNYKSDELINKFDDSKMEYDKIGLTADFPFPDEYSIYPDDEEHADVYFSDDFESGKVDTTKWMSEKGDAKVSGAYMSEGPHKGLYSLSLDGNRNKANGGVVLSRPFENDLNKIVEVKYFDKRQDYAGSDVNEEAVPVDITPDGWVRVDDGKNVKAIGANGDISKDYYLYKNGDEVIKTNVQRKCGWHTFKFDYSSGTEVKMYIDGEEIAALPATSFCYLAMGDWTGNGGAGYYDQVVIYGGREAPPVKPLPALFTIPGRVEAEDYLNMSGVTAEECSDEEGGKNLAGIESGDWMEYNVKVNTAGAYDVEWRVNVPEGKTADLDVLVDGEKVQSLSLASTQGQWQSVSERISLSAGLHKIKLAAKSDTWKLNRMDFAFAGQEAPCKIEAEDFIQQNGTQLDPVSEGGMGLGYIDDNDWMEYKVIVKEPGRYSLNYRVSVNGASGQVDFIANDETLASTWLPGTGGWQNWKTVTDVVEFEKAGDYTIRLKVVKGAWNINWFELSKEDIPAKPLPPVLPETIFEEDFNGENPTVLVPSKDVIKQEVVDMPDSEMITVSGGNTDKASMDKSVSVSGNERMKAFANEAMSVSGNESVSGSDSKNISEDGTAGVSNKVLFVKSPDGTLYLPADEEWSNYIFECKIMISEWKGNSEGPKPWDNMAPAWYVNPDKSYNRYSLKYNRQDEDFLLYRRFSGDKDMQSHAAPENFAGTWHDYKIVMDNGLITAYVDDGKIFETTDTSISSGTIGFDGINVEYYVDDIKVMRQKTLNPAADVPSGSFKEPFTVKLTPAAAGSVIAYTLDGTDPMTNGIVYEGYKGIEITNTTTLKFAAADAGKAYSDIITCEYTLEASPAADKEELQKYYDQYKELTQGRYTDDTWAEFVKARDIAAGILLKEDAQQDEVDDALEQLEKAVKGLAEELTPADKAREILQKSYDYALTLDTAGVAESAVKFFEKAKKNAADVLADPNADGQTIIDTWSELVDAISGLGLLQGDKAMLQILADKADYMKAQADKYVSTNWKQLLEALEAANKVLADGDAMEEDIAPAVKELQEAILVQRYKALKSILEELLNKADAIDQSLYTDESVQVLRGAIMRAAAIIADDTLSTDDQPMVDRIADDLDKAILSLVKKTDNEPTEPTDPTEPTEPSKPSDDNKPSDGDEPSDDNGGGDNGGTDTDEPQSPDDGQAGSDDASLTSPKTGDQAPFTLIAGFALAGALAAGWAGAKIIRRKEDED